MYHTFQSLDKYSAITYFMRLSNEMGGRREFGSGEAKSIFWFQFSILMSSKINSSNGKKIVRETSRGELNYEKKIEFPRNWAEEQQRENGNKFRIFISRFHSNGFFIVSNLFLRNNWSAHAPFSWTFHYVDLLEKYCATENEMRKENLI